MIKKAFLLVGINLGFQQLFAGANTVSNESNFTFAIFLTLAVAIIALIISVINFFRISANHKISEVEMVNQKDDLNVTMEAIKVSLTKDIRNLRKELTKGPRNQNQKEAMVYANNYTDNETETTEKPVGEKKNFKKRPSNYRRKPPYKKRTDNNTDQAGEKN